MGILVCQTPLPTQEHRWYNTHTQINYLPTTLQFSKGVITSVNYGMNITSDGKGGKGWISEDVGYKSRFTDIYIYIICLSELLKS